MTGQARDRFFDSFVCVPTKQSFFTRHLPFTPENGTRIRGLLGRVKNRPRSGVSGILQGFYYPIRNFSEFYPFFFSPKKCMPPHGTAKTLAGGRGFYRILFRGEAYTFASVCGFRHFRGFQGRFRGAKKMSGSDFLRFFHVFSVFWHSSNGVYFKVRFQLFFQSSNIDLIFGHICRKLAQSWDIWLQVRIYGRRYGFMVPTWWYMGEILDSWMGAGSWVGGLDPGFEGWILGLRAGSWVWGLDSWSESSILIQDRVLWVVEDRLFQFFPICGFLEREKYISWPPTDLVSAG